MKICCSLMICLAVLSVPSCVFAGSTQASLVDALQRREQKLDGFTFVWQQDTHQHNVGIPSKELQEIRQGQEKQSIARYMQRGMDEAHIKKAVQTETAALVRALSETSFDYSNTWSFQRSNKSVLVSGTSQDVNTVTQWRQFYSGGAGLRVDDAIHTIDGMPLSVSYPAVWQSIGESVRYSSPLLTGAELSPEHCVMLAGFNPLALHEAKWEFVAETPTTEVLTTSYAEQNVPFTVQVVLSRNHENAPAEIDVSQPGRSDKFLTSNFKSFNGTWIVDKVDFTSKTTGATDLHQSWVLQKTLPSKPISLQLQNARQVHDYRLLGTGLNWRKVEMLEMRRSHAVVDYQWQGRFPSIDALQELHDQQHPGEGSPDPSRSALNMQFMGGLMALTGAVWMFKRRGIGGG